ncbi:MAG: dienelactone hydrolase family protein [bacterium]
MKNVVRISIVLIMLGCLSVPLQAQEHETIWPGESTPEQPSKGVYKADGVRTTTYRYSHAGTTLKGYLAVPEGLKEKRPGVLIVHQWKGLGDYEKRRARQLAQMGYVAFAADIYGADTRPSTDHEAAMASSTFRKNRGFYRKRVNAALNELRDYRKVNSDHLGAIGYCFGGTGVLELARSGADVDAVVSFHGGLANPNPRDARNIKAVVQVHHGAQDPHVSQQDVLSFWNEMKPTDADWELHVYSDAEHGFTESHSDAYNKRADRLSWRAMKRLFSEEFVSK